MNMPTPRITKRRIATYTLRHRYIQAVSWMPVWNALHTGNPEMDCLYRTRSVPVSRKPHTGTYLNRDVSTASRFFS